MCLMCQTRERPQAREVSVGRTTKTGQRGLLIASYKRLEQRLRKGHDQ